MPLNIKAFSLATALVWALALFSIALVSTFTEIGRTFVDVAASLYPGYGPGVTGAVLGFIWGFLDALIGAALLAWIYNKLLNKFSGQEMIIEERVTVIETES